MPRQGHGSDLTVNTAKGLAGRLGEEGGGGAGRFFFGGGVSWETWQRCTASNGWPPQTA